MTAMNNATLADPWRRLWNGELDQLDKIVADDILVHAALVGGDGGDGFTGRTALGGWIAGLRAAMPDLSFIFEVGPIAAADHLLVRWRARGTYRGGMPGVPESSAGAAINFTGTDILRVEGGKLVEYWVQQLGVIPKAT
jgi:hypothetical protein